jgi:predicted nucleic acid-binding Zn ribbon protein
VSDEPRPGEEERGPGEPPPDGPGEPPEEEGPPPPPRCEVCGAELEPDQTYCLECGSPTPMAPRPRRSGKWIALLALAMIVLGGGAGALAYAVVNDDDDGGGGGSTAPTSVTAPTAPGALPTAPSTGPLPPDTSFTSPTTPTDTAGTATGFPTVTGATPPPTAGTTAGGTTTEAPGGGGGGSSDWPSGTTAWTAILSSVRSESDARAAKARVASSGEPAGVLFSSDYPGLRPGYWVVYSGSFPTEPAAEAHARDLTGSWPGAYAKRIEG